MPDLNERIATLSPERLQTLADRLLAKRSAPATDRIVRRSTRPAHIPLSHGQERMWLLERLEIVGGAYNEPVVLRLNGTLDVPALERTFAEIVRRHESLRTRIEATPDGSGAQVVDPAGTFQLDVVDLSALDGPQRQAEAHLRAQAEARALFDLARGPLFRVVLLKLSATEHVLCWTVHHVIWDLWSLGVLVRELGALYAAYAAGRVSPLPEPDLQYADYALWQRERLQGEALQHQLAYWRTQLAGAPPMLDLPTDRPRPAVPSFRGARRSFSLPATLSPALDDLGRRAGATLYMVLLAAFQVLMCRWSRQTDIVVGSPLSGRTQPSTERLIGYFVNLLPMRTEVLRDLPFRTLLASVRETVLAAHAHQSVPLEKLVADLQPGRQLARQPLFQVVLALQNQSVGRLELPGLTVTPEALEHTVSKFDLACEMFETPGGLIARVEYSTELFDASTIDRMVRSFTTLLEGIVADPDCPVSVLPLQSEGERRELLIRTNDAQVAYPEDRCIHDLFEEQAARTPDAVALVCRGQTLTYEELNRRSNHVAHALIASGVGPETLVGLCMERSAELLAAILGILKAGGAYLPIDPAYPDARIRYMFEDGKVGLVLAESSLIERLEAVAPRVKCRTVVVEHVADHRAGNPGIPVRPDHLSHIIYTSGSTGQPKGVAIAHQPVVRLAKNNHYAAMTADTHVLWAASMAFDASTLEIWPTLLNGGCLVALTERVLTPESLAAVVAAQRVDLAWLTASLFNGMIDAAPETLRGIANLMIGGEALSAEHVMRAHRALPATTLMNGYGPTENTVFSCTYPIPRGTIGPNVPIGRPIANTQVYLLDEDLSPVPVGVIGEICVGGPGLARGYLNRPALTAERFIANPFGEPGSRLYRTGDLARHLVDGTLEFVGRIDHQVKIRGLRIELGEIEAVLRTHPAVGQCTVAVLEDDGRKQLTAYVVPGVVTQAPDVNELRAYLLQWLPEYMVPPTFVFLPALPLTSNGKIDRNALPAPERGPGRDEGYVAPRTPIETRLARIWVETLGLDRVGVRDNFFEAGGDSIIAMQIVARASQAGLRLTVRDVFERQTVMDLAEVALESDAVGAEQGGVEGDVPLTPIQRWFVEHEPADLHHFNQSVLLRCRRRFAPALIGRAVDQLMLHHDALRLRCWPTAAGWRQRNAAGDQPAAAFFEHVDLSALEFIRRGAALEQAAERLQATLDLSNGPLLRAALFDMGADQPQRLLIVIHHFAVDGVSWRILLEDLQQIYDQLDRGETVQLPAKTTSFKAWSERLSALAATDAVLHDVTYWERLRGAPIAPLPADHSSGVNSVRSARSVTVSLSAADTTALLHDCSRVLNARVDDVLLTALLDACAAWTGRHALYVDLEGHGREELFPDVDLSRTVGWFTSLFPVLLDAGDARVPEERLRRVQDLLREIPGRGIGYGILRYLRRSPALAGVPDPDVSFNYLGQLDRGSAHASSFRPADERAGPSRSPEGRRRHLIELDGAVVEDRLQVTWTYSVARHEHVTIQTLAIRFIESVQTIIDRCRTADRDRTDASSPRAPSCEDAIERAVPLTPIQRKCLEWMGEEFRHNILVTVWDCQRPLTRHVLARAVHHVVMHHDALRLQLRRTVAGWEQWSAGTAILEHDVLVSAVDLTTASAEERNAAAQQVVDTVFSSIDVSAPPLLRAALVDFERGRPQQLVLAAHHLAVDPVSIAILMEDLQTACEQIERGGAIRLPARTASYQSWADRLVAHARSPELRDEEKYWLALPWAQSVPLPIDGVGGDVETPRVRAETIALYPAATEGLELVQRLFGAQAEDVILSAVAEAVAAWTKRRQICVEVMHHGRSGLTDGPDLSRTVGWFSAEVPVFLDLGSSIDPRDTLTCVQAQRRCIPHEGMGYGVLRYSSDGDRLASLPTPGIRLNHLGGMGRSAPGALFRRRAHDVVAALPQRLDRLIEVRSWIDGRGLQMQWLYDPATHRPATIRAVAAHCTRALRALSICARSGAVRPYSPARTRGDDRVRRIDPAGSPHQHEARD